jgi:hypothetical protein
MSLVETPTDLDSLALIDVKEAEYNNLVRKSKLAKIGGVAASAATVGGTVALLKTPLGENAYPFVRDYTSFLGGGIAILESIIGYAESQRKLEEAGDVADKAVQMSIDVGIDASPWAQKGRRVRDIK